MPFNVFHAKKLKKIRKRKNFAEKFIKKCFFKVCAKMLVEGFIPRKSFLAQKTLQKHILTMERLECVAQGTSLT